MPTVSEPKRPSTSNKVSGAESRLQQNVGPLQIAIAVVVLAGVLFGIYKLTFRGHPAPSTPAVKPVPPMNLRQLAIQCQGDFTKLSPEQQKQVNAATGNQGAYVLRAIYISALRGPH
ncbi:MAG TPA: hypothetical protein VKV29_06715 [Chthonomonas sp.]|uniref:hypothetical protein n=1 Tax=Chthonomonas sp. TaxID=2282153 RepID=UPI002B4B6647|nr:hypothetical protein [Chthonomonas sp.]HLH79960.1 hypothetical protein [Chthonomonas sp.]